MVILDLLKYFPFCSTYTKGTQHKILVFSVNVIVNKLARCNSSYVLGI